MTAHVLLLSLVNGKKIISLNTLKTFLMKSELAQKNFPWESFVAVKMELGRDRTLGVTPSQSSVGAAAAACHYLLGSVEKE